jgi:rubredoxin
MNRTDQFISSLEDFELAFLKKYKLKSNLKPTQDKILQEISSRRFLDRELDKMIESRENNPENTGCPRCDSNKIRTDQIDLVGGSGAGGYKIAYSGAAKASGHDLTAKGKRMVCEICGFILQDDNERNSPLKSFFTRLIQKFKR